MVVTQIERTGRQKFYWPYDASKSNYPEAAYMNIIDMLHEFKGEGLSGRLIDDPIVDDQLVVKTLSIMRRVFETTHMRYKTDYSIDINRHNFVRLAKKFQDRMTGLITGYEEAFSSESSALWDFFEHRFEDRDQELEYRLPVISGMGFLGMLGCFRLALDVNNDETDRVRWGYGKYMHNGYTGITLDDDFYSNLSNLFGLSKW